MDRKILFVLMVPIVVILNYATSVLTDYLQVPFFLDTWATSFAVLLGSLSVGVAGGFFYSLIMAFTQWSPSSWVWGFSSIWIALITFILFKLGLIELRNPFKIIVSGLIIGMSNAVLTTTISIIAFSSLPTYAGTEPTYTVFYNMTNSRLVAIFAEHFITEIFDKTIAIFMAALAASKIRWRLK